MRCEDETMAKMVAMWVFPARPTNTHAGKMMVVATASLAKTLEEGKGRKRSIASSRRSGKHAAAEAAKTNFTRSVRREASRTVPSRWYWSWMKRGSRDRRARTT